MTDISEYKQIVEEIRKLIQELDKRIDTLHSLVFVSNNKSEIKLTAEDICQSQSKSLFEQEIECMIRTLEPKLEAEGHLTIDEPYFWARTFPPRFYINKLVEIYNQKGGYIASFTHYNNPSYTDKLWIQRKF